MEAIICELKDGRWIAGDTSIPINDELTIAFDSPNGAKGFAVSTPSDGYVLVLCEITPPLKWCC